MLTAVIVLGILAALIGLLLGYVAIRFRVEGDPVVDQIDALLPQTQCGQCTYAGCRPYAEAMANGEADINQCPPGGEAVIQADYARDQAPDGKIVVTQVLRDKLNNHYRFEPLARDDGIPLWVVSDMPES